MKRKFSSTVTDSYDEFVQRLERSPLNCAEHDRVSRPTAQPQRPLKHQSTFILYFDGGSLGNPGTGGSGYAICESNLISVPSETHPPLLVTQSAVRIDGKCTNNQAEYVGLIHGLRAARQAGIDRLLVHGDSELVIKQMVGEYRVKNPKLQVLHSLAAEASRQFQNIEFKWIPREENTVADGLSKEAMYHPNTAGEFAAWIASVY